MDYCKEFTAAEATKFMAAASESIIRKEGGGGGGGGDNGFNLWHPRRQRLDCCSDFRDYLMVAENLDQLIHMLSAIAYLNFLCILSINFFINLVWVRDVDRKEREGWLQISVLSRGRKT